MTYSTMICYSSRLGVGQIGMNVGYTITKMASLWLILAFHFSDSFGVDVILPDLKFIAERREKLAGLILTHGHEES